MAVGTVSQPKNTVTPSTPASRSVPDDRAPSSTPATEVSTEAATDAGDAAEGACLCGRTTDPALEALARAARSIRLRG